MRTAPGAVDADMEEMMFDFQMMMDRAMEVGVYAVLIGPAMLVLLLLAYRLMHTGASRSVPRMRVPPSVSVEDLLVAKVKLGGIDEIMENHQGAFLSEGGILWNINIDNVEAIRQWSGADGRARAIFFLASGRDVRVEEV